MAVKELTDREKALRIKWRGELEALPNSELVVPSTVAQKKSQFLVIETEMVPREQVWELVRSAISDALTT